MAGPGVRGGHQGGAVSGGAGGGVAGRGEGGEDGGAGGGGVEADAVGEARGAAGVVGEDECDMAVGRGGAAEADPGGGEAGGEGDAVGARAEGEDRAFGRGVVAELALEGDGAGEDAAVDLGEGDVHRDVAGAEAALALGQAASVPPAKTTCSTGDAGGVERSGGAVGGGAPTAKLVALRTMSGGASAKRVARVAAEMSSLSEATKIGSGFRPSARRPAIRASTGSRPPCRKVR